MVLILENNRLFDSAVHVAPSNLEARTKRDLGRPILHRIFNVNKSLKIQFDIWVLPIASQR